MARIDKYDSESGGFRAPLAGAWAGSATPIGVGLDSNGRVVAGAGQTGICGVLCKPDAAAALDIVDVMTDGELTEFAGAAGSSYRALNSTGALSVGVGDGTHVPIGHTVEATRLVVRISRGGSTISVSGGQAAIAQVATANATDLATTEALANQLKTTMNTLLTELAAAGVLLP